MSWQHFEQMAADYATARPPYPPALFDLLRDEGVMGAGVRVLEIGAGAGLATRELVASGSSVDALEPGPDLASLLAQTVPEARIMRTRLEDAELPAGEFDAAVAATSLHWVDLDRGLPRLHAAVRPAGRLAVFRTIFGDDDVQTPFRDRVREIVSAREPTATAVAAEWRPTMAELTHRGYFEALRSRRWRWQIDLTPVQVARLFSTFSDWTPEEVTAVRDAAEACGDTVTEHYQSVLHLLIRATLPT